MLKGITTVTTALAVGAAVCGITNAGESTQTVVYGIEDPNASQEVTLSFAPFDDADGSRQLIAVELSFEQEMDCSAAVENNGSEPIPTAGLNVVSMTTVSVEDALDAFDASSDYFESDVLGPSDGRRGYGADFFHFGTLGAEGLAGGDFLLAGGEDLMPFVGSGPIQVTIGTMTELDVSGGPNISLTVDHFRVTGSVTLTYLFTD